MRADPQPRRPSAPDEPGGEAHFVTVVASRRQPWFTDPAFRAAVEREWAALPARHPGLGFDSLVIMPNHLHFILWLRPPRRRRRGHGGAAEAPVTSTEVTIRRRIRAGQERSALGQVLHGFKAGVLRRIREAGGGEFGWEEGYRELPIDGQQELEAMRRYLRGNPERWAQDVENPGRARLGAG